MQERRKMKPLVHSGVASLGGISGVVRHQLSFTTQAKV